MPRALLDGHVHTQFSWDAPRGSMREQCRRALRLGLKAIAFTEHLDSVPESGGAGRLEPEAYLEEVARCRAEFRRLKILSGLEVGEPHRTAEQMAGVLRTGTFDRIIGSLHCAQDLDGTWRDFSSSGFLKSGAEQAQMQAYFRELYTMLENSEGYEVLGHLDVPKRYWPAGIAPYESRAYEALIREVLGLAVARELVLEINTSGLRRPARALCPDLPVLRWWREAGGRAVALGSDAHEPAVVAMDLDAAAEAAEAAGFSRPSDPLSHWTAAKVVPA